MSEERTPLEAALRRLDEAVEHYAEADRRLKPVLGPWEAVQRAVREVVYAARMEGLEDASIEYLAYGQSTIERAKLRARYAAERDQEHAKGKETQG